MAFKTLGELRSDLSRRLGFGAQGSSGINSTLLDGFLQNAQAQIWAAFDWRHLIKYDEKTIGVNQTLTDWAEDCDLTRLIDIAILDSTTWRPLEEGITWANRSDATPSIPTRYERFSQMETWPVSDGIYSIRRYYVAQCSRFSQDNDRASVDDQLIFLHAVTNAKIHYKQSDGSAYAAQLNAMLDTLKSKNRSSSVISRTSSAVVMTKPVDV